MSEPFLGEIRIVGFTFAPRGWAFCNGQVLPIAQNTALFSLLGTSYGGDGRSTFALPDFRNRAPMHWGQGAGLTPRVIGEQDGEAAVTLLTSQLPQHSHALNSGLLSTPNAAQNVATPSTQALFGLSNAGMAYSDVAAPPAAFNAAAIGLTGGSGPQPHENRHPILALNFIIATQGIFPSRN